MAYWLVKSEPSVSQLGPAGGKKKQTCWAVYVIMQHVSISVQWKKEKKC